MKIPQIIAIAACIALAACDKTPERASITADELLLAQGGRVFTVIVPSEVDKNAFVGLALKHHDGTILPFSSSNGLKPNQELKVIIFDPRPGTLRYAILGDGFTQNGESTNFPNFGMLSSNPKAIGIGIDQPIMRFASGNSVSLPPAKLADGEFDLVFHIQKSKSEQDVHSNTH
jgi:hypothetical protein